MDNSNKILDTELTNSENNTRNITSTLDSETNEVNNNIEQKSLEISTEETPSESIDIKNEDANTTNCLALTIQKEHKLIAVKNVFMRSIRMSWKVVVSSITLAIIKLLS